jgi:uncharacterized protein (TIGR04255 family)
MKERTLPSFENPPVQEVAAAVRFSNLTLKTADFGTFWSTVKDTYPQVDDMQPLFDESDFGLQVGLPLLRRVRMSTADEQFSLQIQSNRLITNWRKTTAKVEYPRFPAVFAEFRSQLDRFSSFYESIYAHMPEASNFELTYVNEFPLGGNTPFASMDKYLRSSSWCEVTVGILPEPSAFNLAWAFEMPDGNGQMLVTVNPAKRTDGRDVVLFVLKCTSATSKQSVASADGWFDLAHEWIVRGFSDLTTEAAHDLWKRY